MEIIYVRYVPLDKNEAEKLWGTFKSPAQAERWMDKHKAMEKKGEFTVVCLTLAKPD